MKNIFASILFFAHAPFALAEPNGNLWTWDSVSKFQLGYFRGPAEEASHRKVEPAAEWAPMAPLNLRTIGQPEGEILLQLSLDRGFTFPYEKSPKDLTYFLKFYKYPADLNSHLSTSRFLNGFLFDETSEGEKLESFVRSPENVLVKAGYIRSTHEDFTLHPLPTLEIPKQPLVDGKLEVSRQEYLDGGLVYSTLYITSKNPIGAGLPEAEKIKKSADSLRSLREELESLYTKSFSKVTLKNSKDDSDIFIQKYPCEGGLTQVCHATIYFLPKDILFFSNARERPRPQGPPNSFGSGLFLIRRIDYTHQKTKRARVVDDQRTIQTTWKRSETRVFELGSLVQL